MPSPSLATLTSSLRTPVALGADSSVLLSLCAVGGGGIVPFICSHAQTYLSAPLSTPEEWAQCSRLGKSCHIPGSFGEVVTCMEIT